MENEEYEIRGHTDGIIEINGRGRLGDQVHECSQHSSAYEPKPDHLIQLNVYMFCAEIPRACLLYECKDNQKLKEFFVKQDPGLESGPGEDPIRPGVYKKGEEPSCRSNLGHNLGTGR